MCCVPYCTFASREDFEADVAAGRFLECTEVIVGYGAWAGPELGNPPITVLHGTTAREVKRIAMHGKMPVLEAGPRRCCRPRHATAFEPSFLECKRHPTACDAF